MLDDNAFAMFVFSFTTVALGFAMAFVVKDVLLKVCGGICRIFSRSLTTSIEIQGSGKNVTIWLKNLIEHNCDGRLYHFGVTNDIYNLKCFGRMRIRQGLLDESISNNDSEKDDRMDMKKQLDPLQISQRVLFFYKRTCISVTRNVVPELRTDKRPTEVYKITAYGTRNHQILLDLLEEAQKRLERKPSKHINYFKASHSMDYGLGGWRLVQRFQPRSLSSIVLKDGITEAIQEDLEEFLESKQWYKERGIPYRRGYLLYGPPGCGKTSFVKAIAGQIGYDIHELQLSNLQITDDSLTHLMQTTSRKAILLFEDVDAVFVPRIQDEERSEKFDGLSGKLRIREPKGRLSFSGLLNAIDGVSSEEDYILFMTTNQIEKLDSALIRPGRIDMRQLIDYPDEEQIISFFRRFYQDCDDDVAVNFGKAITNLKCNPSVAQIQGVFLKHKHKPEDSLADVNTLIDMCKSNVDLAAHNIYV